MQFRNDIQGLRAIAFILVYIFHLNPHWLPGGYIGVDMFFVISGYLITSIILHQKEKGTFSFLSFYEKRIKRIVPAYYVAILFIAVAGCYFYLQADTIKLRSALYRSIAFLSNQFFASGESYFGAKLSENPLLHTWSLAIEMQFYLILPFLLIFIRNKWLPYAIGGLLVILTGYSTYGLYYTDNFSAIYFSLFSRMPEFFIGVVLSIFFSKKALPSKKVSTLLSIFGLSILILTAFLINEETLFPGVLALLPCTAVGFLLISGENLVYRFLASKPMVYIGELSYSLYLWHWPIMAYLRYQDPARKVFTWQEIIFISILTFILAWLSYTFVEQVFRKQSNKKFLLSFTPIILVICILTIKLPAINFNSYVPHEFTQAVFGTASHSKDSIEVFGDVKSLNKNIALIGDSHALVLKPFFDYLGKQHNFSIQSITSTSYPSIEGLREEDFTTVDLARFKRNSSLLKTTKELINKSDIIFINSLGFHRKPSMITAMDTLAERLKAKNKKLVIFITTPVYRSNPLRLNKGIRKNITSPLNIETIDQSENEKVIRTIEQRHNNVYVYDLSKSKVFNDSPFYRDTLMYYDHSHLNLYGSLAMAREEEDKFMAFFQDILKDLKESHN